MSNFMKMLSHHNQNNSQYKSVVTAIINDYTCNHPLPSYIVYSYMLRVHVLPYKH